MTIALLLIVASLGWGQDIIPCLSGQGPLQLLQERCADPWWASGLKLNIPELPAESYFAAYGGSDWTDLQAPLVMIQFAPLPESERCKSTSTSLCINPTNWKAIFALDTTWTFRVEGKEYALTGKELADLVKAAKPPAQGEPAK